MVLLACLLFLTDLSSAGYQAAKRSLRSGIDAGCLYVPKSSWMVVETNQVHRLGFHPPLQAPKEQESVIHHVRAYYMGQYYFLEDPVLGKYFPDVPY